MNISFDLDSTLITGGDEFETEKRSFIARWAGIDKIRKGAPALISKLQKKGHIVHIYTIYIGQKEKYA
jgi:phosphoserine phosphatase